MPRKTGSRLSRIVVLIVEFAIDRLQSKRVAALANFILTRIALFEIGLGKEHVRLADAESRRHLTVRHIPRRWAAVRDFRDVPGARIPDQAKACRGCFFK